MFNCGSVNALMSYYCDSMTASVNVRIFSAAPQHPESPKVAATEQEYGCSHYVSVALHWA